jgi:hypothetical protein
MNTKDQSEIDIGIDIVVIVQLHADTIMSIFSIIPVLRIENMAFDSFSDFDSMPTIYDFQFVDG